LRLCRSLQNLGLFLGLGRYCFYGNMWTNGLVSLPGDVSLRRLLLGQPRRRGIFLAFFGRCVSLWHLGFDLDLLLGSPGNNPFDNQNIALGACYTVNRYFPGRFGTGVQLMP